MILFTEDDASSFSLSLLEEDGDVSLLRRVLAKRDLAKKSRVTLESAKTAHEDLDKLVQRKMGQLAALEEEQRQVQESAPAVADPAITSTNLAVVTKQMFVDILAAAGSEDSRALRPCTPPPRHKSSYQYDRTSLMASWLASAALITQATANTWKITDTHVAAAPGGWALSSTPTSTIC